MISDLISVIIPVYNVENYLDTCLTSVLGNTYKNIEVICINDGSSDNSLAILKTFENKDNRIIVVDKDNQGVSNARNVGLKAAHGDWISFVDSDDWIHPQFFETLLEIGRENDADVIAGNHIRKKEYEEFDSVDLQNVHYSKVDLNEIYRNRNLKNFVWGKLYKKEILAGKQFDENIAYGEDFLFNAMIYSNAKLMNIISVDATLYFYNDRDGSVVNSIDNTARVLMGKTYIGYSRRAGNEIVKNICLTEGIKRVLLARYTEKYTKNRRDVLKECNKVLKNGIQYLSESKSINTKTKLIYTIFSVIPSVYRLWRIADDPTMRLWEKNERDKNKRLK